MDTNEQNDSNIIAELRRLEELDENSNELQPSLSKKWKYTGIGRLWYFSGILFAGILWTIMLIGYFPDPDDFEGLYLIGAIVFSVASLLLSISRLQNTGTSGWWSLLTFIPIADLFVRVRCLMCPMGYNDTKKLDTTGKIIAGIIVCFSVFFVICLVIGWIVTSGSLSREVLVWNYLGYLNRL